MDTSSRLGFKPHLRAHVISASEVALIGERERYVIRGELYAALTPLLDGLRSGDEIATALSDQYPAEQIYYALAQLEAKGYTGEAQTDPRAVWWSAHGVTAETAAEISATPIAVISAGAHEVALERIRAALGARHLLTPDIADAGLSIIASSDYLDPRLAASVMSAATGCAIVLPVCVTGAELWFGPLVERGDTARFELLVQRLAANRPADATALRHGAQFPLAPVQYLPVTLDLAAAWISSGLLGILAGGLAERLRDGVRTIDPWTLESRFHPIATGGQADAIATSEEQPVRILPRPKRHTSDGGHRTCPPDETLKRLEPFVSPISGIIPRVEKLPAPDGMHVYAATQTSGVPRAGTGFRANRTLGRPLAASGKGETDTQARVSCLAEAIERYSCGYFGDEKRRSARMEQLGGSAIDPRALLQFSADQYRRRDATNAGRDSAFTFVPEPFDPARAIDWTPAWSLTHDRTVYLPSVYCYFRYPIAREHDFCRPDSNGCASGNTIEEAILQGLMELVERDACAIWWYNRAVLPGIDLASFSSPYFDRVARSLAESDRDLHVLDLTNDLGITAVMAVSSRCRDGGRVHLGLGCHLSPRTAVSRALSELTQAIAFEFSDDPAHQVAYFDDHARWLDNERITDRQYLKPRNGMSRGARDLIDRSSPDIGEDVRWCVDMLAGRGLETIVLEHTRPEIGFPVARVAVPGLRHFWSRLAPGRLYDVPPKLGWIPQPLDEASLNPVSFFF
jgi:oxazoline/thiazoline synthase